METQLLIHRLEHEWDLDSGFLGKLREGQFDPAGFGRLVELLNGSTTKLDMSGMLAKR